MKHSAMPPEPPPARTPLFPPGGPRHDAFASLLAIGLLVMAGMGLAACSKGVDRAEAPLAGSQVGGDFALIDKAGKTVRSGDFSGKWRILYFGYTFCPDVCPLDVQHLMQGFHAFERAHPDLGARMVPMFVSIDPARDTPQAVGQFAAAFGPELVGLTGSTAQVAGAAKAFAVYYEKRPGRSASDYMMDHSRAAYLMDGDGKPVALLPVDEDGKAVAAELEKWVH